MTGRHLADIGIETARQHAEAYRSNWTESVLACLEIWCAGQEQPFAIEDFRQWVQESRPDLIPPSPNAWGAIGRLGLSRGIIRWTRTYRPARSPATHGHPVRVFVRAS